MDLHPTPFRGKRRSVATISTAKTAVPRPAASRKPPPAAAAARPKRAFGVVRNPNVPVEKPLSKPRKPSAAAAATGRSGEARVVGKSEKSRHVSFQEPPAPSVVVESDEKGNQEEAIRTPVASIKAAAIADAGTPTPYHSAQNCSKCRLDRLETAAYWLGQIRLAESVGKHAVSAAFFRLASDCHAQPFAKLQAEIRSYAARHQSNDAESVFGDLLTVYGLPDSKSSVDCEVLADTEELGCEECSVCDNGRTLFSEGLTIVEEAKEEGDHSVYEHKQDEIVEVDDGETVVLDLTVVPITNSECSDSICCHCERDVSGQKSNEKKSPTRGGLNNRSYFCPADKTRKIASKFRCESNLIDGVGGGRNQRGVTKAQGNQGGKTQILALR